MREGLFEGFPTMKGFVRLAVGTGEYVGQQRTPAFININFFLEDAVEDWSPD